MGKKQKTETLELAFGWSLKEGWCFASMLDGDTALDSLNNHYGADCNFVPSSVRLVQVECPVMSKEAAERETAPIVKVKL